MPSGIESYKDLLELIVNLILVLGVPAALFQYFIAVRKEQRDREYAAYDALDDKYREFQQLCLAHPELDVWDLADTSARAATDLDRKRELQMFAILISLFERAFLMYSDLSSEVKRKQWGGWDQYIRDYCGRANFRRALAEFEGSGAFDRRFDKYLQETLASLPPPSPHPEPSFIAEALHADGTAARAVTQRGEDRSVR